MPEETIVASCRVATARSFGLDPREQLDVELLGAVLVGDVEDDQAALLELVGDVLLGDRLDLAAGRDPGEVHRLEDIGRHRQAAIICAGAAEQPAELLGGMGARLGELLGDLAGAHELRQRGVHRLHPVRAAGLEHRVDLVALGLADQVADRRASGTSTSAATHAPGAVGGRQQRLGHDPLERDRQLRADLALLRRAGTRR